MALCAAALLLWQAKDAIFDKGQSKRIWGELYKVLDSSDVVIQVSFGYLCSCCYHLQWARLLFKHASARNASKKGRMVEGI